MTPEQLALDAAEVAELGVRSLHLHPRNVRGAETLDGPDVAAAVAAVRAAAPGVEIGVTTGAWILPDPHERARTVGGWVGLAAGRPDVASVNVHEDGWQDVCAALHDAGVGIELGVFYPSSAEVLRSSTVPPGAVRALAEVQSPASDDGTAEALELLEALAWLEIPVLLHGEEDSAWPVLRLAARSGLDTRIGLEDTLALPDDTVTPTNTALVVHAKTLGA